jgi:hypothetical protein
MRFFALLDVGITVLMEGCRAGARGRGQKAGDDKREPGEAGQKAGDVGRDPGEAGQKAGDD